MSDPLSISASAAGLISLGLEVTKGLIQYYESWKDSHDNVATMLESLEALFKTLKLLNEKILVIEVISRQKRRSLCRKRYLMRERDTAA